MPGRAFNIHKRGRDGQMRLPGPPNIGLSEKLAFCKHNFGHDRHYSNRYLIERDFRHIITRQQTIQGGGVMNPTLASNTFSIPLNMFLYGTGPQVALPVYAFNLTDPGVSSYFTNPAAALHYMRAIPCYRLYCDTTNPPVGQRYSWSTVEPAGGGHIGLVHNNNIEAATNFDGMIVEDQDVLITGAYAPGFSTTDKAPLVDHVRHDWTSIDFMFKGPGTFPVKLTFQTVQFNYEEVAPLRYGFDLATGLAQGLEPVGTNNEVFAGCDKWYDSYFGPRLISPLHLIKADKKYKPYRSLSKHSVTIEPNLTNEADTVPRQLHHREFFKSGRWISLRSPFGVGSNGYKSMDISAIPASQPATTGAPGTGFDIRNGVAPCEFPATRPTWLIVTAEHFAYNTGEFAGSYPSMDFVIRKKHTYPPSTN